MRERNADQITALEKVMRSLVAIDFLCTKKTQKSSVYICDDIIKYKTFEARHNLKIAFFEVFQSLYDSPFLH